MRHVLRILVVLFLVRSLALAQSNEIVPGDNLVVEGIPKLPASLDDEAGRYTEFRWAALSSWHPTKREMLIGTRFADTQQVHVVKVPDGARTQLTFFKDGARSASYHPTDGDYFIFSKDVGGNEFYQKYRYDFATGDITLLTDGKSRNTGGVWSNGGDRFAYSSTRRNGQDVDLWVMNPVDPKSDRMVAQLQGGGWAALDWSPDDRQLLVMEVISANESYLWLIDVVTGEKTLITPKGEAEKVAYGNAQFSKDGKGIYVRTDRESEFQRLDRKSVV
jgi:protease II